MFTIPVEMVFNADPDVWRTALVGTGPAGEQDPVLLVEPWSHSRTGAGDLIARLEALGQRHAATRPVQRIAIYPGSFPVDIRHNAKINRERLTAWANAELGA